MMCVAVQLMASWRCERLRGLLLDGVIGAEVAAIQGAGNKRRRAGAARISVSYVHQELPSGQVAQELDDANEPNGSRHAGDVNAVV
jgi:hypothetical protein